MEKKIPVTPGMRQAIDGQMEAFRKKFHREMGPDDPIFFDPDSDTPQPISEAKLKSMFQEVVNAAKRQTNIRPELLYAIEKTGLMVTERNIHGFSREDLAACDAAIDEYRRLQ